LLGFGLILLPWVAYASARSQSIVIYSTNFVSSHIDGMAQFPGNPVSETFRRRWAEIHSVFDLVELHLSLLRAYPGDWLRLWAEKIWRPWYASESGKWNVLLAIQSFAIAPPVLGGIYLWILRRGFDLGFIISLGVISYFWLIAVSVWSINRYMPPAYPFLGMFMGFSAHVLSLKLFQKRSAGS
jgi:hypothetical protein